MIASLTGQLLHKAPTHVVIDAGGIGYEVKISLHTYAAIKEQTTCQLLVHQYIKGDVQALYGFASSQEKQWFLHLINVNSVGPRTALTILSSLNPTVLEQTIAHSQVSTLKAIKGIGDKAAQRIILELQGKLKSTTATVAMDAVGHEALAALVKLGISQAAAEKALAHARKMCTNEASVETLIKQALQAA